MLPLKKQLRLLLIDFGCPNVKKLGPYLESLNHEVEIQKPETLLQTDLLKYQGLILSGGPSSVRSLPKTETSENLRRIIRNPPLPILGICYGAQLMAMFWGAQISSLKEEQKSWKTLESQPGILTRSLDSSVEVYLSHRDIITELPNFEILIQDQGIVYAFENPERGLYATQFHPEAFLRFQTSDPTGERILNNFLESCY